MSRSQFDRVWVGGIPFQVTSLTDAADWLMSSAVDPMSAGFSVRLSNAYCVALASFDRRYRALLRNTGINFPDGAPVVAVMRLLGGRGRRASRVRGPSVFRLALQDRTHAGVRHYFVGSTPDTLQALRSSAERLNPEVQIAGMYSPPFARLDDVFLDDILEKVRGAAADIVWVSLGTPKQDFTAQVVASALGVTAVGVGAGFDFLAGTKPEAPVWIQSLGLEWAFRFASEPGRLWRRYLLGSGWFMVLVGVQLAAVWGGRLLHRPARRSSR